MILERQDSRKVEKWKEFWLYSILKRNNKQINKRYINKILIYDNNYIEVRGGEI